MYNHRRATGQGWEASPLPALVTVEGAHRYLLSRGQGATYDVLNKDAKALQWKLKAYRTLRPQGEVENLRRYGPIQSILNMAYKQKVVR